ncbi:MAG: PilZ domain-containing protein [Mesorhizobium sp.]|uniref:PilZ domain-containing protein n=1 Tax=Mesorhizobium sp. M4A.F.Ca.ET.022.05.2.1 TaxID=2496653 RepID=UPI000FCAA93C|nr:PilZ domain-containing protein [Mesorhizobium sp. M4A.F.Ca.ET.022.05.2.1]TIT90256.1 MAG: PilZ domain-containing protein [Mesorhizobium sp.]RVC83966.1 PilZ domain-containing protein [Mesorhizobium sp. M4A.F.Ca.ET.022.05.2.1]TIU44349.1 MAG: PilZ domain-containing protein [Mesorhizobium sp.]TIV86276.1 MAG: PilZ domain-containing protein [Mesorhizobium sp.]TJW77770.1 MAG: PilZ domain-containing protein [Mesorhizobium sp.]
MHGGKESREQRRRRVLKGASILTGISNSEVKCTVRNMHSQGAELQVSIDARVPNEFLLYIPTDGVGYKAVVQWRRGDKLGVMFLGTEPKPHWHYG